MALQYNLDFLYVALIVSLLIFGHFKSQPSALAYHDLSDYLLFDAGSGSLCIFVLCSVAEAG